MAALALAVALAAAAPAALGWAAEAVVVAAHTEDAASAAGQPADSAIQLVSYSTGQHGSRLKWRVKSTGEVQPVAAEQPLADVPKAELPKLELSNPEKKPEQADPGKATLTPGSTSEQFTDRAEGTPAPAKGPATAPAAPLRSIPQIPGEPGIGLAPSRAAAKPEIPPLELAQAGEECPKPGDLKPVTLAEILEKVPVPPDPNGRFPLACPLPQVAQPARGQTPITFTWKASALCHKPLYFEDVQLERYGHSWGHFVQPLMSGAHFVATVPALPYLMGLNPPTECMYTLGYYRPGSCAPYMLDPLPTSIRAGLTEGGVLTGLILLIP